MNYFSNAKVGDKVWDYIYGEGEIDGFDTFCGEVNVKFPEERLIKEFKESFTKGGKLVSEHRFMRCNQRLFYYDNRPIVITQDDLKLNGNEQDFMINLISDSSNEYYFSFKDRDPEKYTRKIRREELNPIVQAPYRMCGSNFIVYPSVPHC